MKRLLVVGAVLLVSGLAVPPLSYAGASPTGQATPRPVAPVDDPGLGSLPTEPHPRLATAAAAARTSVTLAGAPQPVGSVRIMPVLDLVAGVYRLRPFTLRAIGEHVEVWVQQGSVPGFPDGTLDYPPGDCRNDGVETTVNDDQLAYLVDQFDTVVYPKESAVFSVPAPRSGTNGAILAGALGAPSDYYAGDGSKVALLVENIVDDFSYDPSIGIGRLGSVSPYVNDLLDRNTMLIDGAGWIHRLGPDPLDAPTSDPCTSKPAADLQVEGTVAHEYQHVLEVYEDPDEAVWVNEGLSDWAMTLAGYSTPGATVESDPDHFGLEAFQIQCFLGWFGACGGPENSLTRWGDQPSNSILADYGAADTMIEMLAGRYGTPFITALHRADANGFAGIDEALASLHGGSVVRRGEPRDRRFQKVSSQSIFADWTLALSVDDLLDRGARIDGVKAGDLRLPSLHTAVSWTNPDSYSSPGAPPNGSDYVQLRDAAGRPFRPRDIQRLSFTGARTTLASPLQWSVVADPPGHPGNPALYSGSGDFRDQAAIRRVGVPRSGGALSFNALWDLERSWDFAYVQVSTDGGASFTSLACTAPTPDDGTTSDHDPGAVEAVVAQLPGFTGTSGVQGANPTLPATWVPVTCNLGRYAGKTVLLSFRTINDGATQGNGSLDAPGFYVDDIAVSGTAVSDGTSLVGFQSEFVPVFGYTVQIVSIDSTSKRISVARLPLTRAFNLRDRSEVGRYVDRNADFVGAIVTFNDPTETAKLSTRYQLTVNGVLQPGG